LHESNAGAHYSDGNGITPQSVHLEQQKREIWLLDFQDYLIGVFEAGVGDLHTLSYLPHLSVLVLAGTVYNAS
jgi:hypothetical protein